MNFQKLKLAEDQRRHDKPRPDAQEVKDGQTAQEDEPESEPTQEGYPTTE